MQKELNVVRLGCWPAGLAFKLIFLETDDKIVGTPPCLDHQNTVHLANCRDENSGHLAGFAIHFS